LQIAVGRDVRTSSPSLQKAVIEGLTQAGVHVIDIGMGPTELMYFAVGSLNLDGGIQVSASHNPGEYNGLKMVRAGVEALSADTGLADIKRLALGDQDLTADQPGTVEARSLETDYIYSITKLVDLAKLPSLKIVANNNFGASGPVAKKALQNLQAPVELVELNFAPDGTFPKGRPDPLAPENRAETSMEVKKNNADLGVAWDADGDRCYIADENGEFIEGCHLTALLAEHLLKKHHGERVIYEPRNIWAVEAAIKQNGGVPVMNKAGHTFIKNRMKQEGALFGGEMSGHYYYRDFFNADNGLLTFLYFLEIIAQSGQKVSEIAKPFRDKFFVSGEINFKVKDIQAAIDDVKKQFPDGQLDTTDGISLSFKDWRLNLRPSNTEPLLRLNVEALNRDDCLNRTNRLTEILRYHTAA